MRRTAWVLGAAAILAALIVTGGVLITSRAKPPVLAAQPSPARTAQIEQRTLSAVVSQPGTLTYRGQRDGSPYTVINQTRGTYTELPTAGQVIAPGHVLYRVNDRPVVLLRGSTPAYRTLSAGARGPDVAELNADLVALGYAGSAALSPRSAFFGAATTGAVNQLQSSLGVTQNGTLALGQAVFAPTAVRVTTVSAPLGGSAQPGQRLLLATSTTRQVQMALSASQQSDLAVGDTVTITLPNDQTTKGAVASVASVATCPSSSGPGAPGSSAAAPGTDTCSSGASGSMAPTVAVDVTFTDAAATGTWDQAPVQVGITTGRVRDALVVPVSALLARSDGSYAVEVRSAGAANHLVPVSLGLFDDADGLVQVTGSGLAAGDAVVVPST